MTGRRPSVPRVALRTARLALTPPTPADAPDIARAINDVRIAATTTRIPHPYSLADAEAWIGLLDRAAEEDRETVWLLRSAEDARLIGACGVHRREAPATLEAGYWIAADAWGRGYATEALRAVCAAVFAGAPWEAIVASNMEHNPASGRVLEKAGFRRDPASDTEIEKWGRRVALLGRRLTRADHRAASAGA